MRNVIVSTTLVLFVWTLFFKQGLAYELSNSAFLPTQSATFLPSPLSTDFVSVSDIHDVGEYTGEGQRVYIFEWDDVVDYPTLDHISSSHDDEFYRRSDLALHTTMVAAIVGENGGRYPGMIPDATISVHPLLERGNMKIDKHSISVNPWGVGGCNSNLYSAWSRLTDQIALNGNLPMFSVSNTGRECNGDGDGYFSAKSGAQTTSKNGLAVGTYNMRSENIDQDSATGPSINGRIVPEIVAQGVNVIARCSAKVDGYCLTTGSSVAVPQVASAGAVISQAYTNKTTDSLPNHAVKASLLVSTKDVLASGVDYKSGYGLLDLSSALDVVGNNQLHISEWSITNTSRIHTFTIPFEAEQARIILVWNDRVSPQSPLGLPFTPSERYDYVDRKGNVYDVNGETFSLIEEQTDLEVGILQDDLNLMVVSPDGGVYYPQILDPLRPYNAPTLGMDSTNVVESVWLDFPSGGVWEVRVSAADYTVSETVPYTVAFQYNFSDAVPLAISLTRVNTIVANTHNLVVLCMVGLVLILSFVTKQRICADE